MREGQFSTAAVQLNWPRRLCGGGGGGALRPPPDELISVETEMSCGGRECSRRRDPATKLNFLYFFLKKTLPLLLPTDPRDGTRALFTTRILRLWLHLLHKMNKMSAASRQRRPAF